MSVTSRRSLSSSRRSQANLVFLETATSVRPLCSLVLFRKLNLCTVLTDQSAGGIIVPSSGRLIACLGVDDLVIVDMPDTLMVTTRARSQEVKRLVAKCKSSGWKSLV
jgi:hypothetical protein